MDLTSVFSQDHTVWDNVEQVTHLAGRLGGEGAETAVSTAKRRALTYKELAASGGAYTGLDKTWLVPAAVLTAGFVIRPGDTITDSDDVAWTVLEAALGKFKQTWKLTCRDLVLVNALTYTVDIERAQLLQDATGGTVRRWPGQGGTVPYAGVRASVQPQEAHPADERGMRAGLATYHVIVERQLRLMLDRDRVKWTDTTGAVHYLDILRLENPVRLDELPRLVCEIRP